MSRMTYRYVTGAESIGSASSQPHAQRRHPRVAWIAALLALLIVVTGCAGGVLAHPSAAPALPPSSPLALPAPHVVLGVETGENLYPGNPVEIWLAASGPQPVDEFRLSIDGADTGWTNRAALKDHQFAYEWTAGEPGVYAIVGEARDSRGRVGESRLELTVHPRPEPAIPVTGTTTAQEQEGDQDSAPAQDRPQSTSADSAPSVISTGTVVLPTYPQDAYRTQEIDADYNWPYYRFDRERYLEDAPLPANQAYQLVILENELLRILILPELGGRIWQVIHKPTGNAMFYQNPVVKPSPWGPANQLGWLGLGGIEWDLPVNEHGYDWGTPWAVRTFVDEDGAAVAEISTPDDGRFLAATVDVRLPPAAAYFEIEPHIQNVSDAPLQFDYWHSAMLAPGPVNQPSAELRFVLPGNAVRVHSSGDERLPGPGRVISWPQHGERDLSRLGDWDQYSGFFEYPAAHGPFAGVYDPAADAGAVRVFPADIARGSKVFGLGWGDALTSEYYTDDGSAYVELHGGLAPTFSDRAHLDAGEAVSWHERWYPVNGIGEFATAGDAGALAAQAVPGKVTLAFYPSEAFHGEVVAESPAGREVVRQALSAPAGFPAALELRDRAIDPDNLAVHLEDAAGRVVLSHTLETP